MIHECNGCGRRNNEQFGLLAKDNSDSKLVQRRIESFWDPTHHADKDFLRLVFEDSDNELSRSWARGIQGRDVLKKNKRGLKIQTLMFLEDYLGGPSWCASEQKEANAGMTWGLG